METTQELPSTQPRQFDLTNIAKEDFLNPDLLKQISACGQEIYERDIKHIVEPEYNRKSIAIDVNSGEYEIGIGDTRTRIALRKRIPNALSYTRLIGPPFMDQLAYRIAASRRIEQMEEEAGESK